MPSDSEIREALRSVFDSLSEPNRPGIGLIERQASRVRIRKAALVAFTGAVLAAAVVVPVWLLLPLSGHNSVGSAPSGKPLPVSAQVSCSSSGASMSTPAVQAQRDGVHFVVNNVTDHSLTFEIQFVNGLKSVSAGPGITRPQDPTSQLSGWQIPPGVAHVGCGGTGAIGRLIPLRISDPNNYWVSPDVSCDQVVKEDYTSVPQDGTPLELVHEIFQGLRPTDAIQLAGYPGARDSTVQTLRVLRDGRVIATATYSKELAGWSLVETARCTNSGL